MTASETVPGDRTNVDAGKAATRATYAAFIGAGVAASSWASRIPQVKDRLHLDPSELGLVLLAIAAGSIIALPLAGMVVTHFGSRRTVTITAVAVGVALWTVSVGYNAGVAVVVAGLFLFGLAFGSWDVAMNVQGALVEHKTGRSIMPRFHAGFSLGTVGGALSGAAMVALHVPVPADLSVVGLAVALGVPVGVRRFLPDDAAERVRVSAAAPPKGRRLAQWRETRTVLVGLFVLAFAFAEGTGNDWISVAVIEGRHTPAALGTLGYGAFLFAMTAGRWTGPNLITRFGRVVAVRILAAVGIAGILLFVLGPTVTSAFAGALLWGAGASLGFPLGMSAGADDPALAAPRVSVIASIGYCAFLAGPPFIGFLGNHVTVRYALLAVGVLFTVSMVISGAIRPLRPQDHVQLEVPAEPGARPVQSAQDLTALGSRRSGGREELRLE